MGSLLRFVEELFCSHKIGYRMFGESKGMPKCRALGRNIFAVVGACIFRRFSTSRTLVELGQTLFGVSFFPWKNKKSPSQLERKVSFLGPRPLGLG